MLETTTTRTTGSRGVPITAADTPPPNEWRISDEVVRLREWGTSNAHPLPTLPPTQETFSIGAAEDCWLRLYDPTGRVSRRHAELTYSEPTGWTISDLRSRNGVHLDGVRLNSLTLVPGIQVRIGGVTLIAESPLLCALQEVLARCVGWGDARREVVDQALYSLRIAATHREPLLLCGPGNLVAVARLLHRQALGDKPFVVYSAQGIGPPRYRSGLEALAAAAGGTLCIWRKNPPADLDAVVEALKKPESRVLLVLCTRAFPRGNDVASQIVTIFRSIFLPPLVDRVSELNQIIDGYASDAIATYRGGWLAPEDRDWIVRHASGTLSQIELATRRIVVLHKCAESIKLASRHLSMSHAALSDWLARRKLPQMEDEDEAEEEDAEAHADEGAHADEADEARNDDL